STCNRPMPPRRPRLPCIPSLRVRWRASVTRKGPRHLDGPRDRPTVVFSTSRRSISRAMNEPTTKIRIAAVQMEPRLGQVEANRAAILGKLGQAADAGARLVVFPECALSGYGFDSKEEALRYAEPLPGPTV